MVLAAECETLLEHIDTGLEILEEYFINLGYVSFISYKTGIDNVEDLLKATILLHDLSKGYDEYQERLLTGKGFPKHEYFSAAIADKILHVDNNEKQVVELAIVWHHMAMRSPKILADIKKWRKFKAPNTISLKDTREMIDIITTLCNKWNIKCIIPSLLPNKLTLDRDVHPLARHLWKRITKGRDKIKFYLNTILFLRVLILCDNLAAYRNRSECIIDPYLPVFLRDLPNPQDIIKAEKRIQELLTR